MQIIIPLEIWETGGLFITSIIPDTILMRMSVLIWFSAVSCMIITSHCPGQDPDRPLNNISLNLNGDASLLSIHYERLILINHRIFFTGNTGIGFDEPTLGYSMGYNSPPDQYLITFPHHISCNFGRGRHFFEVGAGGSYLWTKKDRQYFLYPVAGYRMQPMRSERVNLRIYCAIPVMNTGNEKTIFNPVGVSIGICF
jgi:hypothetical protein